MALEDHDEIANLVYLVDEATDLGDFDGVGALLAHAMCTVAGTGKQLQGAAAVVDDCRRSIRLHDGSPRTLTLSTNLVVEPEPPDSAPVVDTPAGATRRLRARSVFTVWQQTAEVPLGPILGGVQHDVFEQVDGRWRFARRHVEVQHVGDLSGHVVGLPS